MHAPTGSNVLPHEVASFDTFAWRTHTAEASALCFMRVYRRCAVRPSPGLPLRLVTKHALDIMKPPKQPHSTTRHGGARPAQSGRTLSFWPLFTQSSSRAFVSVCVFSRVRVIKPLQCPHHAAARPWYTRSQPCMLLHNIAIVRSNHSSSACVPCAFSGLRLAGRARWHRRCCGCVPGCPRSAVTSELCCSSSGALRSPVLPSSCAALHGHAAALSSG